MKLSYHHLSGGAPLIGSTIDAFFRGVVRRFAHHEFVVSLPQLKRLTYAAFDEQVEKLARGLMALNVAKGDRVGIWATNNIQWVLLQMATARVGAILVNINPACQSSEVQHALRQARVQSLFLIPEFRSSNYVEMVCGLCPELTRNSPEEIACERLPDLQRVIVYDPKGAGGMERPAPGFLTWADVIERGEEIKDHEVDTRSATLDPDDPINIQFTSGTTGFPKAVVLTHHNILNNGYFAGECMHLTEDDRLCVTLPFYHCFGMVVANLACMTHGAAVIIPAPHFDAGASLAAVEHERCTAIHGVPTMFVAELEHPDFHRFDLSSLRTGIMAGAPCPPELVRRVIEDMGCEDLLIGYGQTEASPITHLTRREDPLDRRVGTVGTNLPHQEVKIVDSNSGALLPVGEQGEVCFRGYHVMRGYYDQQDATHQAIDAAGWLHSGDLGSMDEDGYLQITGRLKDMIIRGGENIYPAEIEALYFKHPKVAEVAVFGVPDKKMGEEVGAWIQLHGGVAADPEEFRTYAKDFIAHFKVPRYVWIVNEFPMTVTGKIQKFRIREIAAGWLERSTA